MTEVFHAVSQFLQVYAWIYQIRSWNFPSTFFPGQYLLVALSFEAASFQVPQQFAQSSLYSPNRQIDVSQRRSMSTGYVRSDNEQPVQTCMWTVSSDKLISNDKWTVEHSKQAALLSFIMRADLSIKWSLNININSHIYGQVFQMEESSRNHGVTDP